MAEENQQKQFETLDPDKFPPTIQPELRPHSQLMVRQADYDNMKVKKVRTITFADDIQSEVFEEQKVVFKEQYEFSREQQKEYTKKEQRNMKQILSAIQSAVFDHNEHTTLEKMVEEKWQDPSPNLIEGIFEVDQTNLCVRCCSKRRKKAEEMKILVFDQRALYCLHFNNPLRIELVNFTSSTMFENIVILLIFANSIILAIYDYNDREHEQEHNQRLELIEKCLTILFTVELCLKILAQGFIIHYNAYLRDAWNWLDFIVVVTGIMEMMELSWFKVRALRTLRVLRPLRSIKAFPKMRQLVSSLVGSVNSLLNAVVFMFFIFMLFGILGIQQFQGAVYQRCRFTEEPLPDGTWPFDKDLDYICSPDGQGLVECPADRFCKQPADANLPFDFDNPNDQPLIFYNMIGFDNLGWAMLTIFQMITLEQWTTVMYLLMDSNIWWMAVIFCVALVIIGSFFLLNVILAVLADALNMVDQVQTKSEQARLTKIRHSLERADAQQAKLAHVKRRWYRDGDDQPQPSLHKHNQGSEMFKNETVNHQPDISMNAIDEKNDVALFVDRSSLSPSKQSEFAFNQSSALSSNHDDLLSVKDYDRQLVKSFGSMIFVPERATQNRLFYICFCICTHWTFTLVITILIVANTVVLALEKYPEDVKVTEISNLLNEVFTWAFFIEMVVKVMGLGFREYARDSFNLFDAFIVVSSLFDMILTVTIESDSPTGALSAFRGVRLLRVFKLARSWSSFREILSKILVTIKDVSTFSVLLLMFMFIFSLLGMELFGHKVQFFDNMFVAEGERMYDEATAPRPNFNNLYMGFTSIFAVAIGDDWNYLMAMAYRAEGFIAIAFYTLVFIFMNLILLNLFLAILLQNFETRDQTTETKVEKAEEKTLWKFRRRLSKCFQPYKKHWNRLSACCEVNEEEYKEQGENANISGSSSSSEVEQHEIVSEDRNRTSKSVTDKQSELEDNKSVAIDDQFQQKSGEISPEIKSKLILQFKRTQTLNPNSKRGLMSSMDIENVSSQGKSQIKAEEDWHDENIPGNQQDDRLFNIDQTVVQNNIYVNKLDDSTSMKKSSEMLKSKKLSEMNKSKIKQISGRSNVKQVKVRRIASQIPKEYKPNNLRKIMRKKTKSTVDLNRIKEIEETTKMMFDSTKLMSLAQMKKMELIEKYGSDKKNIKVVGRSLFIFSKENCLRKICYQIVKHPFYDTVVLVLIAVSTIMLTIDNPNMDESGSLASVLHILDFILTTLFTFECLINIILFGLLCNGKNSYTKDPWNIMDLLIVTFSLLTLILAGSSQDLSILKVFRMLRVLRPLRFLKRNLGLKIQVVSLMNAIPNIANLLLISLLILMIFGIQAVGILKGTFYYCNTVNVPDYAVSEIKTKWDCLDYGGDWVNQAANFDNVMNAMLTMFGMMSTEGWLEVMWSAVDATQIDQVPSRNNQVALIIFFSFFMIVGSLFILNLFVGVVINTFNIEKEKLSKNALMTDLQDEYVEVLIKCYSRRPLKALIETGNKFRDQMSRIVQHPAFEIFIFSCICLNTIVLAMSWYGMNQEIIDILEILNYIFTVIYTIEMVAKMIAFGKGYFKDGWCFFDFIIVLSAWIGIILLQVFDIDVGSISTIIRSFRIARVLKLIKTAKNLHQIFQTFILAIPELINVGALLMLFLFLFAVLGVSLFAEIKTQETMDRHANFDNFGRAILVLLRVATGEGWVGIMQDAARRPSILFSCMNEGQSYESKQRDGIQGCGNNLAAYIYFVAFILMVSYVFLNLFIAIILEGFAASASEQKIRCGDECLEAFQRAWRKYDPQATEMMAVDNLESLIMDLIVEEVSIIEKMSSQRDSINFNLHKSRILLYYTKWKRNILSEIDRKEGFNAIEKNKRRQRGMKTQMRLFISKLQIPLYNGMQQIQFHDTLNAFIGMAYRRLHEKFVFDRCQRIGTKLNIGEKLEKQETIEVGSEKFWELRPLEQESLLECTEADFQKVINRLENKGNVSGEAILKLSFMRRLRMQAGRKFSHLLFVYNGGDENLYQQVFDSSHFVGARTIQRYLIKRRQIIQNPSLAAQLTKKKTSMWASSHGSSSVERILDSQKKLPSVASDDRLIDSNMGESLICDAIDSTISADEPIVMDNLVQKDNSSLMMLPKIPPPVPEELSPMQSIEAYTDHSELEMTVFSCQANSARILLEQGSQNIIQAEEAYGASEVINPQLSQHAQSDRNRITDPGTKIPSMISTGQDNESLQKADLDQGIMFQSQVSEAQLQSFTKDKASLVHSQSQIQTILSDEGGLEPNDKIDFGRDERTILKDLRVKLNKDLEECILNEEQVIAPREKSQQVPQQMLLVQPEQEQDQVSLHLATDEEIKHYNNGPEEKHFPQSLDLLQSSASHSPKEQESSKKILRLLTTTSHLLKVTASHSSKQLASTKNPKTKSQAQFDGNYPYSDQFPKTVRNVTLSQRDRNTLQNAAVTTIQKKTFRKNSFTDHQTTTNQEKKQKEKKLKSRRKSSMMSQHRRNKQAAAIFSTHDMMWFQGPSALHGKSAIDSECSGSELNARSYSPAKPVVSREYQLKLKARLSVGSYEDTDANYENTNTQFRQSWIVIPQPQAMDQPQLYNLATPVKRKMSVAEVAKMEPMGHALNGQPLTAGIQRLREQLVPPIQPITRYPTKIDLERQLIKAHSLGKDRGNIKASLSQGPGCRNLNFQNQMSSRGTRKRYSKKLRQLMDTYSLI